MKNLNCGINLKNILGEDGKTYIRRKRVSGVLTTMIQVVHRTIFFMMMFTVRKPLFYGCEQ